MDAAPSGHPPRNVLTAYGLGKLDGPSAEVVGKHLEECPDCRKQVAEMSADSFLQRARDAQAGEKSADSTSPFYRSQSSRGSAKPAPIQTDTLPPGLADHADYEILRELGRGGMGVVYLAQNKLMGRKEVLKVVSGHLIDRAGVGDRFLREIRAAANLHHTNIVTAYAAFHAGKSLVFAMQYVEGYDLARLVKGRGPLDVAQACNFVHQAALGLQYAHEKGMVHRDIKPSNLMVARQGNKPVVKVLDFGLAKVTSEGQADSGLTREGQMLGTPDYIAPEQIRNAQSADIRADIYSLGCTLYCLLAGRPPFTGDSLWDLYQAHFSMDANPLNLLRPDVPVELAALVAKMMAKEPHRRFQMPGEVAQLLTRFYKLGASQTSGSAVEISRAGSQLAPLTSERVEAAPTQTSTAPSAALSRWQKASKAAADAVAWESLVDIKEDEPLVEGQNSKSTSPKSVAPNVPLSKALLRPSRSMRRAIVAASVVGVLALGVIVWVATDYGRIKIVVDGPEPTVTVDGNTVRVGGLDAPIRLRAGEHELAITWRDSEFSTRKFVVRRGSNESLHVEYEPTDRGTDGGAVGSTVSAAVDWHGVASSSSAGPERHSALTASRPGKPTEDRSISLFDGKDFRGWSGFEGRKTSVVDPASHFGIEAGELVSRRAGRIFREVPLADFSLRFEYSLPPNSEHGRVCFLLRLESAEPYRVGQGEYRVSEIGCLLADGDAGDAGDVITFEYESRRPGGYVAKRAHEAPVMQGRWNEVEIRCKGTVLQFLMNGRQVNRVEANRAITASPGFNSFRDGVRFRNIREAPLEPRTESSPG
jgi:serine/threonine protein kinase